MHKLPNRLYRSARGVPEPIYEPKMRCPYCKGSDVVKYGKRKCWDQIKQKYHCNICNRHFIEDKDYARMKGGKFITNIMVDLHSRGVSLREIQDHLKKVHNLTITHSAILRRIQKHQEIKSKNMKATKENVELVFNTLLSQLEDENGRGEFDNESDLLSAVEMVVKWIEDENKERRNTKQRKISPNRNQS